MLKGMGWNRDVLSCECGTIEGICGHTGKCRECGGFCPHCDEHEENSDEKDMHSNIRRY